MTQTKKNILYIHHDGNVTGSTISLRNLLASVDRKKFNIRVLLASDGPSRKLFENLNIPVDIIKIHTFSTCPGFNWYKLSYYLNLLAFLPNKRLKKYLQSINPDIIHNNDKALLSAGLIAKGLGYPIVWHIRSSYFPSYSKLQARLSRNIIRRCATQIIVISEDEMDGFEDLPNVNIIHNSVDFSLAEESQKKRGAVREEFGLSSDEIAIATITSTINEVRGTWDFINSAGIIHRQLPQKKIRFFVVARIPPKIEKSGNRVFLRKKHIHPVDKANSLIKENSLEGCLTLSGYRDDPLAVMSGMDIIVVCNRHGVLGRMPFEAMSVGTPVVATAGHSGKSNIIIDMETAIIVHSADPESIASGIVQIILNKELCQKLIEQGKISVHEHFDPQKNARLVEAIYEEISV